jgi:hypothetical protein
MDRATWNWSAMPNGSCRNCNWFVWFIELVWFNQINKTNQINQINETDQTDHMNTTSWWWLCADERTRYQRRA